MAKQGQRAEINTFIQGLITEASPLNFPPNASREEENFELFRDGTRKRRLGLDYEPLSFYINSGISSATDLENMGKTSFTWDAVGGDPSKSILVIQVGSVLYFYNRNSGESMSSSFMFSWGGITVPDNTVCSFAAIEGRLVVAYGAETVAVMSYSYTTNLLTQELIRLKVRDFWGIENTVWDDATSIETNPFYRGVANPEQAYNLRNQSWAIPRKNDAGVLVDPLALFTDNHSGRHPANTEVVWSGLQYQPVTSTQVPYERIYLNLYDEVFGADTQSSKGFFIIDALLRGGSRKTEYEKNVDNFTAVTFQNPTIDPRVDYTAGGAKYVAEFAGRVFYTGFEGTVVGGDKRSPNLSNYVMFSQLVKSPQDISKCYQEGDPSSREGSDIVDTDGGYLRISGAKEIYSLQDMTTHLVVFADNGVWAISGGNESGFSATNYKVSKVSSFGAISTSSIANYGGTIMYWGDTGIYKVGFDKFGALNVDSISQTTIQKFYEDIPYTSKKKAIATYDDVRKRIIWTYYEGIYFTSTSKINELVLDLTLGCFYVNSIKLLSGVDTVSPIVPFFHEEVLYMVMVNPVATREPGKLTFATYNQTEFKDWKTYDVTGQGVDAKAFLLTGSQIAGDSAIMKQTPYLVMHFRKTETETNEFGMPLNQSGCLYRTQWDWATGPQSHKFSSLAQAYKYRKPFFANLPDTTYDNGFETVTSKNKIRGRGRAFALYLETEPAKDCNILGWNLTINGNALA